jgi:ATP-dependent exoDNAse (exonuclease V) beta subunit
MIVPAGSANAQGETLAGWLKAIIVPPREDDDPHTEPINEIRTVPGTRATYELKRTNEEELETLEPLARPTLKLVQPPKPVDPVKPVLPHRPRRPKKPEPVTDGIQQLSLFAFADETPESEPPESQSEISSHPGTINYSLIESIPSEARDLKKNSLAAVRISPRQGHLELSPILVGNYFHALLERLPPGTKQCDDVFLRNVALLQGNEVAHKDALAQLTGVGKILLNKYFESELFKIVAAASERHHELPYMWLLEDRLDTKRPDLLIKNADQSWHVIDYKTDVFPVDQIEKQAKEHRKQLEGYAAELSQLLSEKVSPYLYFAQHGLMFNLT